MLVEIVHGFGLDRHSGDVLSLDLAEDSKETAGI